MIKKTPIGHYIFPRLEKFENLKHAVSTTSFGDMNIKVTSNEKNIRKYANLAGLDDQKMIFMQQEHTKKIKEVKKSQKFLYKKVDGLISNKNVFLNTMTADCVPLIFFDPVTRTIATAHSGWKGTYKNIAKNVLKSFIIKKIDLSSVIVAIGPSIKSCCYSIDEGRSQMFINKYPKWQKKFLHKKNYKFFLNLQELIKLQLIESGIRPENIEDANICTRDSEDFFSYREQDHTQHTKVFITSIGLI